ncbi:MAG: prepilin-type N-terminal cleavage/methylation domain-containing protein [Fimbriiglobus sp.]|jgi:prepilin-type N-terminal cleavage/methylation domain-containing protein|nr:prepilin-type N-terminal cleavage/methylation domain-containing protein [Fimbriiglobus sp.]
MTRSRHPRPARHGFTLVELMVATALVVLILTILAVAFGAATDSLSRLRSMGNMATALRTTQDKLRADLESPHFLSPDSPVPVRLSDLRYDRLGTPQGVNVTPPAGGYFRIEQGTGVNNGSIYEGADADTLKSTRATNHALEFTVQRLGRTPDELFTVTSPLLTGNSVSDAAGPGQFSTNWARVRWHLGTTATGSMNGVPTFTLYRCVRLLVPDTLAATTLTDPALAEQFSTFPVPNAAVPPNAGPFNLHTVQSITSPLIRAASPIRPYSPAATPTHYGDDIVLSNVLSFEVKPTWDAPLPLQAFGVGPHEPRSTSGVAARQLPALTIGNPIPDGFGTVPNTDAPFDDLPSIPATENPALAGQRVFDTWAPLSTPASPPPPAPPTNPATFWNQPGSNDSIPLRIRVTALQVKIRVGDPKTNLVRQISFIVQP